jgi:hypothetical protein
MQTPYSKVDINEALLATRTTFWQILKEARWDGHVDATRSRLNKALVKHSMSKDEFVVLYDIVHNSINMITEARCKANQPCFAKHVMYGGDDCHFMDMPAHLITLGPDAVNKYLNGGVIQFTPMECFDYAVNQ